MHYLAPLDRWTTFGSDISDLAEDDQIYVLYVAVDRIEHQSQNKFRTRHRPQHTWLPSSPSRLVLKSHPRH